MMKMVKYYCHNRILVCFIIILHLLTSSSGSTTAATSCDVCELPSSSTRCNDKCQVSCHELQSVCTVNCYEPLDVWPSQCRMARHLHIIDNIVHTIDKDTFADFDKLTHLKIVNNDLESIAEESFVNTDLEYIDFSENSLTVLEPNVFKNLNRLKYLYLKNNKLTVFKNYSLPNLIQLDLSKNQIHRIMRFERMQNFTDLDLSHNQLGDLANDFLGKLINLTVLNLSNNRIRTLNVISFVSLKSLEKLFLDNNDIQTNNLEDPDIFKHQTKLQHLSLSNNSLTRLPNALNHIGKNLTKLTLNHNQISLIDGRILSFRNLHQLSLINNSIYPNNSAIFREFINRSSNRDINIFLEGNPICEQYIEDFRGFYNVSIFCSKEKMKLYLVEEVTPTPNSLDYKTRTDYHKEQGKLTIICAITGSVLFVFIIMLFAVWRKAKSRRRNCSRSVVSNMGYNYPGGGVKRNPSNDELPSPPPPPVPMREPLMTPEGPYMNETISSKSASYIQPNSCTGFSQSSCPHGHQSSRTIRIPPRPRKQHTQHQTTIVDSGSIVVVGINHGGTAKARISGLPKLRRQLRAVSQHIHRPVHYMARRETTDGRPVGEEEATYMIRDETPDGRPKNNTIGACRSMDTNKI